MNKYEEGVKAITDYIKEHPEEAGKAVDRATVYKIAHAKYPDISIEKNNMLPTDICWNIINGNDENGKMLRDFQNWPHALLADGDLFRLVGTEYNYEGPVYHRGWKKNYGYWKDGVFTKKVEDVIDDSDFDESIRYRRDDLVDSLKQRLKEIPVVVASEANKAVVKFQDDLICGVSVEEETYRIYNASSDWAEKTTYRCEKADDGTWFYYLETIDECIGECYRLVMFEARKGSRNQVKAHTSELSQIFNTPEKFEKAYATFLDQADKNAVSGKANGGKTPYGISEPTSDGLALTTHFGQGAAGKIPYLNWHVVSIYYVVDEGRIVMGIERDRYPHINEMKPLRYEQFENRKTDIAVFYEDRRDSINYKELHEKFIEVSEQVMQLGT